MPRSEAEYRLLGQIGIQSRLATEDATEMTKAARQAFDKRFYDQTDPGLPEAERQRRAGALRKVHFAKLAAKSAAARRQARTAAEKAQHAAAELAAAGNA